MVNENEFNYGVLYSFQPDYLREVKDEISAQLAATENAEESVVWQSFASEVGAFFTKS